jgi:ubiquinone/menaquinone biosynthesis C-methylase UbiE
MKKANLVPDSNFNVQNVDREVVNDFGREWEHFNQRAMSESERTDHFNSYFSIFPWHELPADAVGFDAGCGTGRWALLVAPRVKHFHCVDPSNAIFVAQSNLAHLKNCSFHHATIDEMPIADGTMDFGYSLGVLHHIPDTAQALATCVRKLKRGAPFLVYLYYAFDNRPFWFRWLYQPADWLRYAISRLPFRLKCAICDMIAMFVYMPLSRLAYFLEKLGVRVDNFLLSAYRHRSFYSMRTDSLDRFGTKLEQRFTAIQICEMMSTAGLEKISFSQSVPFWCAVGYKS